MLDPKAVSGDDFPGEPFRVLKENEIKKYGEYRMQRLVLFYYRAWRDGDMHEFERWLSPRAASASPAPGLRVERVVVGADTPCPGMGG